MVETLETATQWANLQSLHRQVARAIASELQRRGTPALVMCHVSHVYETGASLYFTFLARQRRGQDPIGQWHAVKRAAERGDHGGRRNDHPPSCCRARPRPWMAREIGAGGLRGARPR